MWSWVNDLLASFSVKWNDNLYPRELWEGRNEITTSKALQVVWDSYQTLLPWGSRNPRLPSCWTVAGY